MEVSGSGITIGGGEFGIGGRGGNNRDTGGVNIDGGVVEGGVVVSEGVMATGLRARTREGIKGGIGVGLEKHTGWAED